MSSHQMVPYRGLVPRSNPSPIQWWKGQTPRVQVATAFVAAAGTAALVTVAVRYFIRPKPFTQVSPQCNDFALADRSEVTNAIRPMVRAAENSDGGVDPFSITTQFVRKYASHCRTWPEPVRNPGEALLFIEVFREVLRVMEADQLVSPEQTAYFLEMVSVWGSSQGVEETSLPMKPPPTDSSIPASNS